MIRHAELVATLRFWDGAPHRPLHDSVGCDPAQASTEDVLQIVPLSWILPLVLALTSLALVPVPS